GVLSWEESPLRTVSGLRVLAVHFNEVMHDREHPAKLGGIAPRDRAADPSQAKRAKRVALLGVRAVGRANLLDDELSHPPSPPAARRRAPRLTRECPTRWPLRPVPERFPRHQLPSCRSRGASGSPAPRSPKDRGAWPPARAGAG